VEGSVGVTEEGGARAGWAAARGSLKKVGGRERSWLVNSVETTELGRVGGSSGDFFTVRKLR
jgi:hypothetical protein